MRTWLLPIFSVIACGDNAIAPFPGDKPESPDGNDPAFTVDVGAWFVIGDAVTASQDTMTISVQPSSSVDVVDVWAANLPPIRLAKQADGTFTGDVSIGRLGPGTYTVLASANGSDRAFAEVPFNRSAPYYLMVSTDYDFSDPGDNAIAVMDNLHVEHPGMRITHFWAPYTYTDPVVSPARQDQLTAWILGEHTTYNDEIGLHIHPYCNFVEDAGVTCITDQSTVYPAGDTTGYTIQLAAYGHDNMNVLLDHAAALFVAHGLGTSERCFAPAAGRLPRIPSRHSSINSYIADSSALNWARIEEWKGHLLYDWTMEHWAPIDDTSQPWWPNQSDILANTVPRLPLLEVPDNGVMIDYVSPKEMNGIFDANWNGAPLSAPVTLMMGFHPATQFSQGELKTRRRFPAIRRQAPREWTSRARRLHDARRYDCGVSEPVMTCIVKFCVLDCRGSTDPLIRRKTNERLRKRDESSGAGVRGADHRARPSGGDRHARDRARQGGNGRGRRRGSHRSWRGPRSRREAQLGRARQAVGQVPRRSSRTNPGLRIEQINKQLGTTTKDLALPIRKLIAEGALKAKGEKRSTTYFAGEGGRKKQKSN